MIHRELDIQDGTVAILRDPQGVAFGLYHRTDVWDEVRDYSADKKKEEDQDEKDE